MSGQRPGEGVTAKIRALWAKGLDDDQISARLGIPRKRIAQVRCEDRYREEKRASSVSPALTDDPIRRLP